MCSKIKTKTIGSIHFVLNLNLFLFFSFFYTKILKVIETKYISFQNLTATRHTIRVSGTERAICH